MTEIGHARCECEWLEEDEPCSEPIYAEHDGKQYCVLHCPEPSKIEAFAKAIEERLDENNDQYLKFVGVWFPAEIPFDNRTFATAVDFSRARFSTDVDFSHAEFHGANFSGARFGGYADFEDATFCEETSFWKTHFEQGVCFAVATFEGSVRFVQTRFSSQADFAGVEFKEDTSFMLARFENIADFSAARILDSEHPQDVEYPINWRRSRFRKAQFRAAFFAQCSFKMACFGETADFRQAVVRDSIDFSIADFNESDFSDGLLARANFEGAFFVKAPKFNKTEFFHTAVFSTARFPGADFVEATFSGNADFSLARFEGSVSKHEVERLREFPDIANDATTVAELIRVAFDRVTFKEGLTFKATDFFQDRCLLTFEDAVFEKPDRVKFQAVSMPPHTFISVDPRDFHFTDVRWGFIDKPSALKEAKAALAKHNVYSPPMLEVAYRQLAVNAEENNRYEEAANLRYLAMEVARARRWRRVDWLRLSWWYWLLSGYGERVRRAFAALLVIWLTFALIYWAWGDTTWWQPKQQRTGVVQKTGVASPMQLNFPEALLYSGGVMALQKPEPLPANKRAKFFVLFETVLGPLQAALLALAIRRKFMR